MNDNKAIEEEQFRKDYYKEEVKHISDLTLGEAFDLITLAYLEGWESDDGFLLATSVKGD